MGNTITTTTTTLCVSGTAGIFQLCRQSLGSDGRAPPRRRAAANACDILQLRFTAEVQNGEVVTTNVPADVQDNIDILASQFCHGDKSPHRQVAFALKYNDTPLATAVLIAPPTYRRRCVRTAKHR